MELEVGARIRVIRESAGLLAQELAARVGLDPTAMSKIETGKRAIKTEELTRIAEALKISPLALLNDDPLLSNLPIAARRAGSSTARGDAYKRLLSLSELHVVLADAGLPTSPNLYPVPQTAGMSWLDGAKTLAAWASHNLEVNAIGDQRFGAIADLIEARLKVDVLVEAHSGDPLSGATITDRSFPMIFVNSDFPRSRCLFTLAHELGHLLAGHTDDPITLDRELSGTTDAERMANAFAAIYLMPEDEVTTAIAEHGRKVSTLVHLVYSLGVSYESLVYRLHNLRLIDAEVRDQLKSVSWSQIVAHLNDPELSLSGNLNRQEIRQLRDRSNAKPVGRPPALLLNRALDGYQKGIISIRPLAALKGVAPDELLDELEGSDQFRESIAEADSPNDQGSNGAMSDEELFAGNPV